MKVPAYTWQHLYLCRWVGQLMLHSSNVVVCMCVDGWMCGGVEDVT